ncbi:hypothetical protein [Halococcus agarilyticus]|uniref:hypothetical protein n=1 Tax=Halococcus agarilyticus TaxID=1232219 RepID=UPI000677728E|nr:hypothetical protein [Halococcus agarilyticus]
MEHIVSEDVAVVVWVAVPGQATWLVTIGASLVLILMLVGFGGFVYQSMTGDGITWPDERSDDPDNADDEGVERSRGDDEWEYY